MRTIVVLSLVFFISGLNAQTDSVFVRYNVSQDDEAPPEYKTDTLTFDNPTRRTILTGTTKLPMSSDQLDARRFNVCLDSIASSNCEHQSEDLLGASEIKSVMINDSSIVVNVKFISNCCFQFLCDIGAYNDSTLNILVYGYGNNHCACDCCFGLEYYLYNNCFGKGPGNDKKITGILINGREDTYYKIK